MTAALRAGIAFSLALALLAAPLATRADEGGASLYLSGAYGSLAAVPGVPGWSVALVYYHGSASFSDPAIGDASVTSDLGYAALTYTLGTPVFGGQLALGLVGAAGRDGASLSGVDDSRYGFNDLVPSAALRWNRGVNNYLAYVQGEIPSGTYDASRLANFGLGHGGIDGGAGYTYFDTTSGNEFSAVAGLTYNTRNSHTGYRNGVDAHIDFGASKFVSDAVQVGVVGYWYQQLTADHGQPPELGDFKSRVAGLGPQLGFLFPLGGQQGYLGLKAYGEFAGQNRPTGWNGWIIFSVSPKGP